VACGFWLAQTEKKAKRACPAVVARCLTRALPNSQQCRGKPLSICLYRNFFGWGDGRGVWGRRPGFSGLFHKDSCSSHASCPFFQWGATVGRERVKCWSLQCGGKRDDLKRKGILGLGGMVSCGVLFGSFSFGAVSVPAFPQCFSSKQGEIQSDGGLETPSVYVSGGAYPG